MKTYTNTSEIKSLETVDSSSSLPSNIEAEEALLGAILVDNLGMDYIENELSELHFYVPILGRIFNATKSLIEKGQVANPITLSQYFENEKILSDIGGLAYLQQLADGNVSITAVPDYAKIILDLSMKRELLRIGNEISENAKNNIVEETAKDQIELAESKLFNLSENNIENKNRLVPFNETLIAAIKSAEIAHNNKGNLSGTTTGFSAIDDLLGGLHKSDLIVLAGRPSMGKTALATNMAFSASNIKKNSKGIVAFFSLEMSDEQLANRILAERASISPDSIRRGKLSNENFTSLVKASDELSKRNFYIDDTPALTVSQMKTRARRLKRKYNNELNLIVVDYLQLMRGSKKTENRVQEISEITQGLKSVAKNLNVPVLALSQLSRAVEQREDKRPHLSDLRESGTIEQDADVVMFIYRQEYYEERAEPKPSGSETSISFQERYSKWQENLEKCKNLADVIVAKQRHGPIGTLQLHFESKFTRFSNLTEEKMQPIKI